MERRAVLRAAASAGASVGLAGLAGCLDALQLVGDAEPADSTNATGQPGPGTSDDDSYPSLAEAGFPPTICEESTQPWALLEIDDPAFADRWPREVDPRYGKDGRLLDSSVVIGRTGGDRPRAYPITILWYHEVCEDDYGGVPSLVTYCSLCRSGMVSSRVVEDEPTAFRATGLLWRPEDVFASAAETDNRSFGATVDDAEIDVRNAGNLVLVDEQTGSYWSQLLARAICGPMEGSGLEILASQTATWGDWKEAHPMTEVLLPPPWSGLDETGIARRN